VWQVKLCDPSLTRAIPERFRDEFFVIKRYTNLRLLYFTLLYWEMCPPHLPGVDAYDRRARVIYTRQARTLNARVGDLQIALEILVARLGSVEGRVGHADVTDAPAGTAPVHVVDDVDLAADETEVGFDAASERHAPVQR